jgi:hypothetical protein
MGEALNLPCCNKCRQNDKVTEVNPDFDGKHFCLRCESWFLPPNTHGLEHGGPVTPMPDRPRQRIFYLYRNGKEQPPPRRHWVI